MRGSACAVLVVALCAGCVQHQVVKHGQYQVEITDRISWWGANVTAVSTCELTQVDSKGACMAATSVGPSIAQAPGVGLPVLSSVLGSGAMVGSAALIRDGLRHIPPSQNINGAANTNTQTATSQTTVNPSTTVTAGRGHRGH